MATAVTISAAVTNTNGTAGMDVWLDGMELGFFANKSNAEIAKLSLSEGTHQLDIYAVGTDAN